MPARSPGLAVGVERAAVRVGTGEVDDAGDARLVRPPPRVPRDGDASARSSVVAAVCGHHLVPPGVQAGHADRVVGGIGARVGEEHHVEIARCQLGDQPRRLAAHLVGMARCDRAELAGLLLDRGDELRVLMADVDVHQLAGEVEVTLTVLCPEPAAFTAGDDHRLQRPLRRPAVEDVLAIVGVRS